MFKAWWHFETPDIWEITIRTSNRLGGLIVYTPQLCESTADYSSEQSPTPVLPSL